MFWFGSCVYSTHSFCFCIHSFCIVIGLLLLNGCILYSWFVYSFEVWHPYFQLFNVYDAQILQVFVYKCSQMVFNFIWIGQWCHLLLIITHTCIQKTHIHANKLTPPDLSVLCLSPSGMYTHHLTGPSTFQTFSYLFFSFSLLHSIYCSL